MDKIFHAKGGWYINSNGDIASAKGLPIIEVNGVFEVKIDNDHFFYWSRIENLLEALANHGKKKVTVYL